MNQATGMAPWPDAEKLPVLRLVQHMLEERGLHIVDTDFQKPWGGEFVLNEAQIGEFVSVFFPEKNTLLDGAGLKLSPKILIAGPGYPLSWQYHHRRAELHRVVDGVAGYFLSDSDVQPETPTEYTEGGLIEIAKGQRHRFLGMGVPCVIAEIWQHVDPADPSDKDDIVRLADAFNRT